MKIIQYPILLFVILFMGTSQNSYGQSLKLDKYSNIKQSQSHMRVASAAVLPKKWDKETNWKRIEKMVTEAAKMGDAQIVVTPEGVLEGYVINEVNGVRKSFKEERIGICSQTYKTSIIKPPP